LALSKNSYKKSVCITLMKLTLGSLNSQNFWRKIREILFTFMWGPPENTKCTGNYTIPLSTRNVVFQKTNFIVVILDSLFKIKTAFFTFVKRFLWYFPNTSRCSKPLGRIAGDSVNEEKRRIERDHGLRSTSTNTLQAKNFEVQLEQVSPP